MCGIYGILSLRDETTPEPRILRKMGNTTVYRGPDDEGSYVGDGIAIGMRRLAIIDLTHGHQPISNEDDTIWVVCNGEIYNFRELRARLKKMGHAFSTGSDTEVIVHSYEEFGDDFVKHLDGMFGFALWDAKRKRLLVGRDRLGIKPLYYREDASRLIFASEAKAILMAPGVSAALDEMAVAQYFTMGYVPWPYSMFEGIQKLPPGSLMVCENGGVTIESYWRYEAETDESLSEEQWAELLLERLESAVVSQMVSDVPIGAFLSGGIDSSTVVAMMARHSSEPIRTYSIGFDTGKEGRYYSELPYARQIAELFRTEHKEIIVKPQVAQLLPKLLWHMDEPIADAAFVTTYLVAELARREVTVILSGVGGDELFGGYRRYLGDYYGRYYGLLPRWLRTGVLQPVARRLPSDRHTPLMNLSRYSRSFILSGELSFEDRYRAYVQVFSREKLRGLLVSPPQNGSDALTCAFGRANGSDALCRLTQVDLATQLPDDLLMLTDKMTMATSIECRVPLLDQALVDLAARMPSRLKIRGGRLKYILKKALRKTLPDRILFRKKRGFGAPMGAWLKRELAPLVRHVLSKESVERRGLFRWNAVEEVRALHEARREDHTDHLLSLLNLELWCRMYLDAQSPADLAAELQTELKS